MNDSDLTRVVDNYIRIQWDAFECVRARLLLLLNWFACRIYQFCAFFLFL